MMVGALRMALLGVLGLAVVSFAHGGDGAAIEQVQIDLGKGWSGIPNPTRTWGKENLTFHVTEDGNTRFMRVFLPEGSIDPGTMRRRGLPRGGAGFRGVVFPEGVQHATLAYRVRFPENFDFVRGGKLPGLYGGAGNAGGRIPDGTDGFSFRLMWGKGGRGSVYAYLPTSVNYGTGLLRHRFHFRPGEWHSITQELILNDPGQQNGILRMWVDNQFVGEEAGLLIRTVPSLRINGMFFEVFFGGNDDSWASTQDTHIDFADFTLRGFTR